MFWWMMQFLKYQMIHVLIGYSYLNNIIRPTFLFLIPTFFYFYLNKNMLLILNEYNFLATPPTSITRECILI